ncbi:hypothetical protein MTR67_033136 [Solanum verrucosum]|uniref:MULE transposase domain-containing protein n=1 Tax=Solanum verrucosum TaxID=315347 RepID=A0AAF0ZGS1_SOLVR|nr:hypothetical protein MTR67_033136 [Solanum verrucosum]
MLMTDGGGGGSVAEKRTTKKRSLVSGGLTLTTESIVGIGALRNERRNKVKKKKPIQTEEIKLGTTSIDKEFEDIGRNKAARYTGRLGGDEQYIDSSKLDSDDSRDKLDPDFVRGVDLPARRKSKKVRFDPDCVLAIFELGFYKGELLVVVGRNGNQQMFPIAWAVVDTETKHSWSFFLNYLIEDLNLGTGHGLTIMSDMQKHKDIEPELEVVHWYRKTTFLKAYNHFLQPIPNMKMWPHTSGVVIEPSEPKVMPAVRRENNMQKAEALGEAMTEALVEALKPGTSGERVITPGVYKDATPTNINIGYKPRGLKWNGGDAVTASQLQHISQSRKNKRGTSSAPKNA